MDFEEKFEFPNYLVNEDYETLLTLHDEVFHAIGEQIKPFLRDKETMSLRTMGDTQVCVWLNRFHLRYLNFLFATISKSLTNAKKDKEKEEREAA